MKKVFIFCLLLCASYIVRAQNYQLHSVYMYSFIKYVQWPNDAGGDDFIIGVYGDSPVEQHLRKMASVKKAGNKNIKVEVITDLSKASHCQMLFIPKETSRDDDMNKVFQTIGSSSILIITEAEGLGNLGSNINFVVRDGKLAFEMNKVAMQRANLKVSTDLTRLAIII